MKSKFNLTPKTLAIAVGAVCSSGAYAQDERVGMLEEVIVTGVPGATTVLESSVSVSSLSAEEFQNYAPRNAAEILRNIPGIRAESGGGEGNSNFAVRGLPLPDGGARFLQLQEDGLPIMLFGDISFGNADGFLRNDALTKTVESIRGGSAATLVSNAPGAVVNFISKTGEEEGGSISVTAGLDHDLQRTDFAYGGPITDTTRFQVGGFIRQGEGPRDAGMTLYEGGQLRANLTKEFDNGFARVYYKKLDDRGPNYYPTPIRIDGDDAPGVEAGQDANQTPFLPTTRHLTPQGDLILRDSREGQHSIEESWGAEFEFDLGNGWSVNNKFRTAVRTGVITGPWPTAIDTESVIADEFGGPGSRLVYFNGPNAGEEFTGPLASRQYVFDVTVDDLGNTFNDLRITKEFNESFSVTFGLFKGLQNIDQEWQWSTYITETKGSDAAVLDVVNADGDVVSEGGLVQYGVGWGLARDLDLQFDVTAPYVAFEGNAGAFSWEVSVRQETGNGTGVQYGNSGNTEYDINQDGIIEGLLETTVHQVDYDNAVNIVNWDYSETAWSIGGNYLISEDLAVFARVSKGWRANADRQAGATNVQGEIPDDALLDEVDQWEIGTKWAAGSVDLFVTLFGAESGIASVDFTQSPPSFATDYESSGIEVEFDWSITSGLALSGSLTWIDAEIADDKNSRALLDNDDPSDDSGSIIGKQPRRQPDLLYTLSLDWDNDVWGAGANLTGQTKTFADGTNTSANEVDGYSVVTLYANWYVTDSFSLSLNVNNAFDETAVTSAEWSYDSTSTYRSANVLNGRNSSITAKFEF